MNEQILIIEDEDAARAIMCRTLKRAGFDVLSASHGEAGVALAMQHRETLRAVITDIVLPGASGTNVSDVMQRIVPKARVILMSGYSREDVLPDGPREQLFIQKPFSNDDLIAVVRWAVAP